MGIIIGLLAVLTVVGFCLVAKGFTKQKKENKTIMGSICRLIEMIDEVTKSIRRIIDDKGVKKLFYYTSSGDLIRAHSTDAGMDICSAEDYVLKPNERHLFPTGVFGILPKGTVIVVKPRSGLAVNFGIDVLAGVVDEGYTGHIKVLLINHGTEDFKVQVGDKIAQLMLMDVYQTQPQKVTEEMYNTLKESKDRGENGFGSSGIKNGEENGKDSKKENGN